MDSKMNGSEPRKMKKDKDIIKEIILEKENSAAEKDKLYRIIYEASETDDASMDTDLIDECVRAVDMMEGENEISEAQIRGIREKVDIKYGEWKRFYNRRIVKRAFMQAAACLVFILLTSSVVANAFGHNVIKLMADWGKDTFDLSVNKKTKEEYKENNGHGNISAGEVFDSLEEAFEGLATKPSLPGYLPEAYDFTYAERYIRSDNTNVLLYYTDPANKIIVFDFSIYGGSDEALGKSSLEKSSSSVEIYEKDDIKHYIFENKEQIQAVWTDLNVIYHINGDVEANEMKKIIDSMH